MAIIAIYSENVKRIKTARFRPNNAASVVVGGRNAQGKTSIMDSIVMAIQGGKSIPAKPVREGQESAQVILETDDLIIHRTVSPDRTSKLVVTNRQGVKFQSTQKMLDKLLGSLSFDPLAFSRMKPAEQEKALRDLLGIDTRRLDAEREIAFEDRTVVNREVKALQAQIEGMPHHDDVPEDEVSAAEIQEALNEAKRHNAEVDDIVEAYYQAKDAVAATEQQLIGCEAEIARLMELVKVEQRRKAALRQSLAELEADTATKQVAAAAVKRINEDEIVQELVAVSDTNRKVAENRLLADRTIALRKAQAESQALTDKIKMIDAQTSDLLVSAKYPIPGLAIEPEGGITLNGIPLEQASTAEQLKTGVAICVAMNPEFPVALIRDASLLDDDSLAMVERFATEHGCQVWMERVGDGDECQIVIEDGEITVNKFDQTEAEKPPTTNGSAKATRIEREDADKVEVPQRARQRRIANPPTV